MKLPIRERIISASAAVTAETLEIVLRLLVIRLRNDYASTVINHTSSTA